MGGYSRPAPPYCHAYMHIVKVAYFLGIGINYLSTHIKSLLAQSRVLGATIYSAICVSIYMSRLVFLMEMFCFNYPREVFPSHPQSGMKEGYGRFSGWLPTGIFKHSTCAFFYHLSAYRFICRTPCMEPRVHNIYTEESILLSNKVAKRVA